MFRLILGIATWLTFASLLAAAPRVMTGKVVGVADGDTITVFVKGHTVKVRLVGVDAPEKKQAFGPEAKEFTSSLVFGKTVTISAQSRRDRYQRVLGVVVLPDGTILNQELVRAGMAWHYTQFSRDAKLIELENEAKTAKRGLWISSQPVPPWEFRRRR